MTLHKSLVKDVSPKAIKHAVLSAIAKKPIIIYPTALALLEALALIFTGFNQFSLIMFGLGLALALSSWVWQYFVRGPRHALQFVTGCQEQIELKRRLTLDHVRKDMMAEEDQEGLRQIDLFQQRHDTFVEVLSSKLAEDELQARRYLTIAEQVFLSGLDNLESASLAMLSVSAVDSEEIEEALAKLADDNSEPAKQKKAEYTARLRLRDSQLQRANSLLLENEQSLTQLDLVSSKLSAANPQMIATETELDAAMYDLQQLITRPK